MNTIFDLLKNGRRIWGVIDNEATYATTHFATRKEAKAYRAALLAFRCGNGSAAAVEALRTTALVPDEL
jgi:hypothetical protein